MNRKEMSRKGMGLVSIIGKVIIPLLIGVSVLGAIQSIKTTSLDPKVDNTEVMLDRIGNPDFPVGKGVSGDVAEQQVKGLIVWNAMRSSDCRMATTSHMFMSLEVDSGEKVFRYPSTPSGVDNFVTGDGPRPDIENNRKNGYIGLNSYQPIINNEAFNLSCIGSKSVIVDIKEKVQDNTGGLLSGVTSAVVGVAAGAVTVVACGATLPACAGGALVVGAMAAGASHYSGASDALGDFAAKKLVPGKFGEFHYNAGFDMEGKYGKMEFHVNKSFQFGAEDRYDPIYAMGTYVPSGKGYNEFPGFWQAHRMMYALPPGLKPKTISDKCCKISHRKMDFENNADFKGFGDGRKKQRKLYAWRVRMRHVPIVSGGDIDDSELTEGCGDNCGTHVKELRNFLEESQYVFCSGAKGYIQSNARNLYFPGEASSTESHIEDQVYPYVMMESGATSCLNPPDGTQTDPSEVYSVDSSDISCSSTEDVGVESVDAFSRPTAYEGVMKVKMQCGGKKDSFSFPKYDSASSAAYSEPYDYWKPETYMRGCGSKQNFNITDDSTVSSSGGQFSWSHDHTSDYTADGDGVVESQNQITYRNFRIKYENDNSANKTFVIDIQGEVSSGAEKRKRIVIEDAKAGFDKQYTINIYEGTADGNPTLVTSETYESSAAIENNQINILRTSSPGFPKMKLKIKGETVVDNLWLGDSGAMSPGYELKNLEIRTLDSSEITKYNDETTNDVQANEEGLNIKEVLTNGQPRICTN